MARSFNGTSAYLEAASAAVTAEPLTMACWFRPNGTSVGSALLSIVKSGANPDRHTLGHNLSGGQCRVNSTDDGVITASAIAGTVAGGAWGHFAGVISSSSSRTAYYNGVAGTPETTAVTVTGINRTIIGANYSGAYGGFAAGVIAHAAIWNVALTASEIAWLAQGARPDSIRSQNLVFYNPLDDRWTYDRARGLFLTDVGPTGAAEDPPFLQKPRRKYFLFGDIAAPTSVIFRNRTGSRARIIA